MRLRSIHPKHLDSKGLVALRRESLLAKKVLEWKTKWYKNHPQLNRFKEQKNPISAINLYLQHIYIEAGNRWFSFDKSKFNIISDIEKLTVTKWQIEFEKQHILNKTKNRDIKKYEEIKNSKIIKAHPIFEIIEWDIEDREIL